MGWKSSRVVATYFTTAVLAVALCACQTPAEVPSPNHFSTLNADPSLFEPPTNDRYSLHGDVVGASVIAEGIPLERVTADASGSITVTDGIMSNAEILATIDSYHQIKFELTEPVVFERQGQVSDLIVGVGKITTSSGVFNDVKVVLTPHTSPSGTTLEATIEIPDSLQLDLEKKSRPLELELSLNPVL